MNASMDFCVAAAFERKIATGGIALMMISAYGHSFLMASNALRYWFLKVSAAESVLLVP